MIKVKTKNITAVKNAFYDFFRDNMGKTNTEELLVNK